MRSIRSFVRSLTTLPHPFDNPRFEFNMIIVLVASGTRGDVQPMLALGIALKQAGHVVRIVAGSNFTSWIESFGLEVHPTVDVEAMMRSELGIRWTESHRPSQQLKVMKQLWLSVKDETIRETLRGIRGADLILGGFVSEPLLLSIQEKFKIPIVTVALQPYRATRSGNASLLAIRPRHSSLFNLLIGRWIERLTWSIAREVVADLRMQLGLPAQNASTYVLAARQIPAIYAFSKHVVPLSDDVKATTTGYWFLDEPFTPPSDLVRFIESGETPVYVGFGSMPSRTPGQIIQMVCSASEKIRKRVILSRGWSVSQDFAVPDHIYVLNHAPHDWLFPLMSAAVHHGGAGTSSAAMRAGIPSVAIPHLGDQPYWGRRIFELGVGAKPIPRHKLTTENLVSSIQILLNDSRIRNRAEKLGELIRSERGIENALQYIERWGNHG